MSEPAREFLIPTGAQNDNGHLLQLYRAIRKQAKTDISKLKGIRNNLRSTIQRHNQMANPEALDIEEAVENNKRMIEEAVEHGSLLSVVTSNLDQSDLGNDGSGFEAYEQALDEVKSIFK